jgi:succinyl-diaminopimelate desuccinylase
MDNFIISCSFSLKRTILEGNQMNEEQVREAFSKINVNKIVDYVQELVKIPTPNPPGKEKIVAERVAKEFEEIGLETQIQEVEPERSSTISVLKGQTDAPALLIEGHIDTVPIGPGEKWIVEPFSAKIIEGKIYGRGSMDNKGGIAVMTMAAYAIKQAGVNLKRDVIFAALADEEGWMRGVKKIISSGLTKNVSECISVDGFSGNVLKQWFPGRTYGYLHVLGRTAHSGTYPPLGVGINAIHKAAKLISKIDENPPKSPEDPVFKKSHWHCLMINGGWDPKGACVVPDRITIALDARLVTGHEPDDLWSQVTEIISDIKKEDNDFEVEIEIAEKRRSWQISMEEPLIKAIHEGYEYVNGVPPKINEYPEYPSKGTMDLHWLAYEGIKCQPLISTLPGEYKESRAHRENEYVTINNLENATKVLIYSILKLCT